MYYITRTVFFLILFIAKNRFDKTLQKPFRDIRSDASNYKFPETLHWRNVFAG